MPFGFGAHTMLFARWKSPVGCCARNPLALVLGVSVVLLASQLAGAQAPGGQAQKADPAASKTAPAKPPAPRLNRSYAQLAQPKEDKEKEYQRMRGDVQRMLRAGTIPADKEQLFNEYYTKYALPRWTWLNRLHELTKYRADLERELAMTYDPRKGTNQAHDKLQALALQYLKIYVNPAYLAQPKYNFAPATRFNAILMIGRLNEVEPAMGVKVVKPLPQALDILHIVANDEKQIDAVRVGALIGLRRHCRLAMEAGTEPPRVALGDMGVWAKRKEAERVRSDEGHAWMRTVAVKTLGDVEGAPQQAIVADILRGIVNETDSPSFLRYEAANSLGSIDYRRAPGLDMTPYLQSLGLLAVAVCDEERQRLRDEMESGQAPPRSGGMMGGMMGGEFGGDMEAGGDEMNEGYGTDMMGGGPVATADAMQIERARRRLQEGMTAVLVGMGKKSRATRPGDEVGLSMLAGGDPAKVQTIDAFSDPIHDFFKTIDAKDDDDNQIQPKPLDLAIVDVRQKLADALTKVGAEAPKSPEFDPIPETKPARGGMGGMEMFE